MHCRRWQACWNHALGARQAAHICYRVWRRVRACTAKHAKHVQSMCMVLAKSQGHILSPLRRRQYTVASLQTLSPSRFTHPRHLIQERYHGTSLSAMETGTHHAGCLWPLASADARLILPYQPNLQDQYSIFRYVHYPCFMRSSSRTRKNQIDPRRARLEKQPPKIYMQHFKRCSPGKARV